MKRFLPIILLALLGFTSLACLAATRAFSNPTPSPVVIPSETPTQIPPSPVPPTPTLIPSPTPDTCPNGDCITACLKEMGDITQASSAAGESKPIHKSFVLDEEYTLVKYTINADQITDPVDKDGLSNSLKDYQKDRTAQEQIWNYFAAIIPSDYRKFLTEYIIFTDGKDNLLAAVEQSDNSPSEWALSVDIMDASNPQDLTFTLIHEYGHLLTLNPDQVIPSQRIFDNQISESIYQKEKDACPTFFPGEGCSNADSYINQFFERFWPEIYPQWQAINNIEDEADYYSELDKFYIKHKDQFVSDYASTDPSEDIAETFSFFILEPRPIGKTIADQKVLFFYGFPELVQLRDQIGRRLCAQLNK